MSEYAAALLKLAGLGDIDPHEFLTDCARFGEGVLSRDQIKLRYPRITEDDWNTTLDTPEMLASIDIERTKRIRNGVAAREKAALVHAEKGIDVLAGMLTSDASPTRARIEASKELARVATPPAEHLPGLGTERFVIQINLGSDIEIYDKPRAITPHDDVVATPKALPEPAWEEW
jgi:hypothetical protein